MFLWKAMTCAGKSEIQPIKVLPSLNYSYKEGMSTEKSIVMPSKEKFNT